MSDSAKGVTEAESVAENSAAVQKETSPATTSDTPIMNGTVPQDANNEIATAAINGSENKGSAAAEQPTEEAKNKAMESEPAVTAADQTPQTEQPEKTESVVGETVQEEKTVEDNSEAKAPATDIAAQPAAGSDGGSANDGKVEGDDKLHPATEGVAEAKKDDAAKINSGAAEETKTEPTSPNSLRKQKASFNVDAKPFSPVALADPAIQGTLVGEANGLSIKVGQWGNPPYVTLPHISPSAPISVGQVPYTVPGAAQAPPLRKETSGVKESLSAFAKPWSPHPEVTVSTIPPPENEVAIHPGSWTSSVVEGKEVQTPSPMVPKESNNNSFAHSFSIHPKGLKSVELEVFNYVCGRCPLKTLYGRLSSRQPDVTMRNVAMDVPPLCVAHLIEQITKAKVTALCVNEVEGTHYDIWLDKPNMAPVLTESISGCVWTCPMHHGYAVLGKGEEGKKYLRNYVERLKDSKPEGPNVYEVALVEVKEH